MVEEKLIIIEQFLKTHGSSLDVLATSKKIQFEKVCDALIARKNALEKAKNKLKENNINIVAIANDTGIARKTFYNNPLLKASIEEFASSLSDFSEEKEKELEKAKEQNIILSEQVRLMSIRDCETEALRHENGDLRREIKQKDIRIRNLEEQLEKALSELDKDQKPKIIDFGNLN